MEQLPQPINDLLQKYLQGACTPAEEKMVDEWYDQLAITSGTFTEEQSRLKEAYLRERLPALPARLRVSRKRILARVSIAAALAGILVTTSIYGYRYLRSRTEKNYTWQLASTNNQQKKILLPDGTEVWLNRFSQLEWQEPSTDSIRLVKLQGEALFRVSTHPTRPFVVQAAGTRTIVLGTAFNVEAYTDEKQVKVALLSGKVRFHPADTVADALLQPGKMAIWSKELNSMQVTNVSDNVSAWTTGFTVFNEVPLSEAIERLAKRNNWQVIWKNKNRPQTPVSATFARETPAQMLAGITFIHQLKYRLQGNTLVIY